MEDTTLAELIADAEKASEPGGWEGTTVIHEGDEDQPAPMVGRVTSAGYTTVYDTKTGVSSKINNNNLLTILKKRRKNGSRVFGMKQTVIPKMGIFKCLLHKDDPSRDHYDDIGLAVCPKDNLSSSYQVMRHMQKRHKDEWAAIDQERKDKEKKEDREFQRMLMEKAVEKAPLYVSDKDKKKAK